MDRRVSLAIACENYILIQPVAQEERQYAIKSFKSGAKDVMVASGVASKGLDFNDIQHVIIFSMPKEIEDYVHQIGRTGRSGKTGIATTFVNMNTPEQTLLDLKYLLMEAGQKYVSSLFLLLACIDTFCRVPPFLLSIDDPRAAQGASLTGCPVCGGKSVTYTQCRMSFISMQVSVTESRTAPSSKMPNDGRWPRIVGRTTWAVIDIVHAFTSRGCPDVSPASFVQLFVSRP